MRAIEGCFLDVATIEMFSRIFPGSKFAWSRRFKAEFKEYLISRDRWHCTSDRIIIYFWNLHHDVSLWLGKSELRRLLCVESRVRWKKLILGCDLKIRGDFCSLVWHFCPQVTSLYSLPSNQENAPEFKNGRRSVFTFCWRNLPLGERNTHFYDWFPGPPIAIGALSQSEIRGCLTPWKWSF